jgi:hypothetical protein
MLIRDRLPSDSRSIIEASGWVVFSTPPPKHPSPSPEPSKTVPLLKRSERTKTMQRVAPVRSAPSLGRALGTDAPLSDALAQPALIPLDARSTAPAPFDRREGGSASVMTGLESFSQSVVSRASLAHGATTSALEQTRHALRDAVQNVPDLLGLHRPEAVFRALGLALGSGAERFGRTGAAFDAPSVRSSRTDVVDDLAKAGSNEARLLRESEPHGSSFDSSPKGRSVSSF